jgi:hypothetical protein
MVVDTCKPVNTLMIVAVTRPWMIWCAARVRQRTEIIVEGMAFLGNNYNVLEVPEIAVGSSVICGEYRRYYASDN